MPSYASSYSGSSPKGTTATSMTETSNTLTHPVGPEYQLVVGEGTSKLPQTLSYPHNTIG